MASTSNPHIYTYDVFLSFRGKDTRNTFTDHLYANLVAHGIQTFRDDEELEKGGDIASHLQRAIEESKIFIVIFSKDYAESKWCLNELVKIIDCMTKKGSMVWPIFYHVDPRDVRNQGGSFGNAFLDHGRDADEEKEKTIEMWKEALKTAGKLSGDHLENQSEAELIQKIREIVIAKLNRKPLYAGDNIIGMDFHLEQLKPLIKTELGGVRMVGIFGPGGIGKTTISIAIYNHISSQFDGISFLKNVGGKCEDGLVKLQKTLLQDILKCKKPNFNNINEGINVIKERLQSKQVLIVLDDVDEYTQLENLAGKHGWYGAKSIIIITTKNQHLLDQHEVKARYKVEKLNDEQSTKVFNWWAFKKNTPTAKFESLSKSVVKYADGLPIALKVLGGLFCNRSEDEWKSQLNQLREIPDRAIQKVLKVSYDKLGFMEQEIFLDIACFFRGEDKDFVSRILGSNAVIGIRVLHDRCLITISENKLDMHDLLQKMGQEIVRQQFPKEPGKRSRLWDFNDVQNVLTEKTGTETIEGLFIEISRSGQLQFSRDSFTKMNRLRLLKIYLQPWKNFDIDFPTDFELSSFELRYLHIQNYPLRSLPANFHTNILVELNLRGSKIKQLWEENEVLHNLKVIILKNSKDLVGIPDFTSMPNLEILDLSGCKRLESLPQNFHKLEHLESLYCSNCSKLKSFPQIEGNMSKLRNIDLRGTAIVEVPSSIEHLNGLEYFDLSWCENLVSLSESICSLRSLEALIVKGCSNLKGFPNLKDNDMKNLETLDLGRTAIDELPSSIGHLKALRSLDLFRCENLVHLPESICDLGSLEALNAEGCSNLKGFPDLKDNDMKNLKTLGLGRTAIDELLSSIGHLKALQTLDLRECENLENLPESICDLRCLETLSMENCYNLKGFPDLKEDMENLKMLDLSGTSIEELPPSIGHLKALQSLDLSGCRRLVNLPETICDLSSLETLHVQGCPKLERLEVKPSENLYLTCRILKPGITWSNNYFSSLRTLNLECNQIGAEASNPIHQYPVISLSSLIELSVRNSEFGESGILTDGFHLSSLELLSVGNFNPMERGILGDIFHQSSLQNLSLRNCSLTERVPMNIRNLSSLVSLSLEYCNLKEGDILDHIFHLSSLEELSLEGNHFSSISGSINRLSNLRGLNLSHCKKLQDIPELPSSLLFLDAHYSDGISSSPSLLSLHSLFNRFETKLTEAIEIRVGATKFTGMGMSIIIPRSSTFLEMIRNRSMGSDHVTVKLPQNWYENNDLLGFALCCVYMPLNEYEDDGALSLGCHLTVSRNNQSEVKDVLSIYISSCDFCDNDDDIYDDDNDHDHDDSGNSVSADQMWDDDDHDDGVSADQMWDDDDHDDSVSADQMWDDNDAAGDDDHDDSVSADQMWVIYYPKDAIKEECRSNEWTQFMASFYRGETVQVKECGFHLIYSEEHQQNQGNEDHHMPMFSNLLENANRRRDGTT